jgi:hypothetical protein
MARLPFCFLGVSKVNWTGLLPDKRSVLPLEILGQQ